MNKYHTLILNGKADKAFLGVSEFVLEICIADADVLVGEALVGETLAKAGVLTDERTAVGGGWGLIELVEERIGMKQLMVGVEDGQGKGEIFGMFFDSGKGRVKLMALEAGGLFGKVELLEVSEKSVKGLS